MAKGHRSQIKRERNEVKDARPSAKLSYARVSVQKACFVLDAIRGKDVATALAIVAYNPRYASRVIEKLLKSAIANAENNNGMKAENIYMGHTLEGVSLELHRGEILGIGGLTDCGMHDLGRVLFGIEKPLYGSVTQGNGARIRNTRQAIAGRIGYVSKNRDQEALILSASILDNTVLPSLGKLAKAGLISKKEEKAFTGIQVENLSIKCREIEQDVRDLSGGNKQKVVFGKWLGNESQIFILDCPTRGIDIGVKAFMYQLMYRLKQEGKSIIMISEELPELIGMSDRIMIMKNGKVQKVFERSAELNESTLIKEMV